MVEHFIQHKGKGLLVFALPMVFACLLFILFDFFPLNDAYIRPLCLLLSAPVMWYIDSRPIYRVPGNGVRQRRSRNQLMWIDLKYWAIVVALIGTVLLFMQLYQIRH